MGKVQNDFATISPQEWKLKVQAELAGLDYNEILVWDTAEGIQVKPVYTREDIAHQNIEPIVSAKDWKIIGEFLNLPGQDFSYLYGLKIKDEFLDEISGIPEHLDLFLELAKPFESLNRTDFSLIPNLKYLNLDVIGNFAKTGNWYRSQEEDFGLAGEILRQSHFAKSIQINASVYQNSGANHVQQIAFAIAHGVEYLEKFGVEAGEKIYFKTAVGGNYFFEIAKLRALRKFWNLILEEYGSEAETFIYVENSLRNKSL